MTTLARRVLPVAAIAAATVALIFFLAAVAVDLFVANRLTADLDQRIAERLEGSGQTGAAIPPIPDEADRSFEAPLVVWRLDGSGRVAQSSPNSPVYPAGLRVIGPTSVHIGGTDFRLAAAAVPGGRLVVGQSLTSVDNTIQSMVLAELVVGPVLLILVFLGTVAISWRVAGPIEHARQQQLAFTADASHELRTPLSVIEAETSLGLRRERDAQAYRGVLQRVAAETDRLRRIVEDLLLLARADSLPPSPASDVTDLVPMARSAIERFRAVASDRSLQLSLDISESAAPVAVPPEWVDRLLGILLDNACRYTPEGGQVLLWVQAHHGRLRIGVDDSGPGIPAEERRRILDRFHRATTIPGGAGLGLAIGDAIVRASRGRWEIDGASIGGARIAVSWPGAVTLSSGSGPQTLEGEQRSRKQWPES